MGGGQDAEGGVCPAPYRQELLQLFRNVSAFEVSGEMSEVTCLDCGLGEVNDSWMDITGGTFGGRWGRGLFRR